MIAWLIVTVCLMAALVVIVGSMIFALLAGAFLIAAPWYLLRRMAEKRRQKIEDQLADAMVTLANAVRAGLSLAQSLEILAAQCPAADQRRVPPDHRRVQAGQAAGADA